MGFMSPSLLIQHALCSLWVKQSFPLSSLIIWEIHFISQHCTDSNSSDESHHSQLKVFWKGSILLEATKNTHDSWEEVQIPTVTGVWKKWIPALVDYFEGFKTLVEEVTTDVVERAK